MEEIAGAKCFALWKKDYEKATAESEFANLVSETTAKVEGVAKMEKQQPVVDGCGSVAGLTAGVTLAATAAAGALRKKKED